MPTLLKRILSMFLVSCFVANSSQASTSSFHPILVSNYNPYAAIFEQEAFAIRATQAITAYCEVIRAGLNRQAQALLPAYAGIDFDLIPEPNPNVGESKFNARDFMSSFANTFSKKLGKGKQAKTNGQALSKGQVPSHSDVSDTTPIRASSKNINRRTILRWTGWSAGVAAAVAAGFTGAHFFHKPQAPKSISPEDRALLESITNQLREATDQYYAEMRRLAHLKKPFNQLKPLADIIGKAISQIFNAHQNDPRMPEVREAVARWNREGKASHMDLLDLVAVLQRYFERNNQIFIVGPVATDIDGFFIPGFYQVMLGERVPVPGGEWTESPIPGSSIKADELAVGHESISFLTGLAAFSLKRPWGRAKPVIVYRIPSLEEDVEVLRHRVRSSPEKLTLAEALPFIRANRFDDLIERIISDLVHADFDSLPTKDAAAFRALVLPALRRTTGFHEWGHLAEPDQTNAQTPKEPMQNATDSEMLAYWKALGFSGFPHLSIYDTFGAASVAPGQNVQERYQNPHFLAAQDFFNLLADALRSDRAAFSMVSIDVPPDISSDPMKTMYFYLAQLAWIPSARLILLGKKPIARERASAEKPQSGSPSQADFFSLVFFRRPTFFRLRRISA